MNNPRKLINTKKTNNINNNKKKNNQINHSTYHQIDPLNSSVKMNKNNNTKNLDLKSNSFYLSKNNVNMKASKNNINFNTSSQFFIKPKNQNIINISNYKGNNPINQKLNKQMINKKNTNNNIVGTNYMNNSNILNKRINNRMGIGGERIKNYIIYLKNHLNSSYYANNDLNNEYNKVINKSKEINESINNNNDIFINLNKSYEENLEKNKLYKKEYLNLVDEYKINHQNEQNKLKELNQMIEFQNNDILKLENENNILADDVSNKKKKIDELQKQIEKLKNKKNLINVNNQYLYLFNKKNQLLSLNEKIKTLKRMKSKNDELTTKMNLLKNNLNDKENLINESQNIQKELSDKLIYLINEDEMDNLNNNYKNFEIGNNSNRSETDPNRSFEIEKEKLYEKDGNINSLYNNDFEKKLDNNKNKVNNNAIDFYGKLLDEENKKDEKIQERMNFYNNEISKLKNEIILIKSKNDEELSLFKEYINNLSPNDEEIQNNLVLNKNDVLSQKENLLKYNKKFKESLSEKNDLKNKISQLKIENNNIELKLNEKQKNIGFKIKAIKIRRGDEKNKDGKGLERNLSDPDLIKNNLNDKLYISQNRENFIPRKDIYRYKRFDIKYRNEKRLLNKFKSRKSSSFDNIFKYNANNKIEKESNIDILNTPRTGKYLYSIDKDGKLLSYGINLKKYAYINTSSIKGWRLFYKDYKNNSNGSLLLNTLAGFFILTGDNYNHLYYYSQSKNMIYLIIITKYNHKYGGLLLTKNNNKIIILGGSHTNDVELFNIEKNNLKDLPSLLSKRINSSYNIINDQYLVAFFGKNNNTIEYLDLNNIDRWSNIEYKTNNNFEELSGHIGFHVNENVVIIVGGENNDKILVFYFKEKYVDVTDIILSFDIDCGIDELIFDKEKCFNTVENNDKSSEETNYTKEIMGMDNLGNVHCFNNDYAYTIFVF